MIRFDKVCKVFPNGTKAVREISFEVAEGETLVLLGTSGSGKTTTMKMVNRLIEPSSGTITVGDKDILSQNPVQLRRSIGYAIQGIGLFPHMTVGENIGVVPRLVGWSSDKINSRVSELLELVGLSPPEQFRDRYPTQLSGGQRQRIGVARALAADPPVILMDEPFGALDPITREQLQDEFIELESRIQKTILFVTHDIYEAVKMGDRIAILDQGEVQQIAPPRDIVESPANEFVDRFLGPHRFQLSLMTVRLSHLIKSSSLSLSEPEEAAETPKKRLFVRNSLIEALDLFKEVQKEKMPVWDQDKQVGVLSMEHLLSAVGTAFQRAGVEQ